MNQRKHPPGWEGEILVENFGINSKIKNIQTEVLPGPWPRIMASLTTLCKKIGVFSSLIKRSNEFNQNVRSNVARTDSQEIPLISSLV